ncbi:MAG TPA: DUF2946 family protein [Sphingomicrobium sp.]
MPAMRSAPALTRAAWAVLLALLLAVRSLAPAGFMPAFDRGQVTIIACPDAGPIAPPMAGHHHHSGHDQSTHQQCPYASASPLGTVGFDFGALLEIVLLAGAILGGTALRLERNIRQLRPPARGPPLPT